MNSTKNCQKGAMVLTHNTMDITFKNVSFCYNDQVIIKDFNYYIPSGKVIALLGPSGCGKSTLLKLLLGLLDLTKGEILFNGEKLSPKFKIAAHISESKLFPWMTLEKNLRTVGSDKDVKHCLKELQMENWADYYPSAISVGLAQKIQMARFSLLPADLWLLDEPFNGLDAHSKEIVQRFLQTHRENKTTIIVTHNLQEATSFADRVLLWDQEKHCPYHEWENNGQDDSLLKYMLQESLGMEGLEC